MEQDKEISFNKREMISMFNDLWDSIKMDLIYIPSEKDNNASPFEELGKPIDIFNINEFICKNKFTQQKLQQYYSIWKNKFK